MFAPNLGMLVASRVLLGFGTSAAYPASMSLLRTEADRTGVQSPSGTLATLTAANQIVTVAGPPLGGLLVGSGGWNLIFALNVPLVVACLVLGTLRLPAGGTRPASVGTDVLGMVLFAGSLTAFMLFLMAPAVGRWYLPLIDTANVALVFVAMLGTAMFIGLTYGPLAVLFSELFRARVRYSGASLGYQLGAILGGGLAPTALYAALASTTPITAYLILVSLITLGCLAVVTRQAYLRPEVEDPQPR